MSFDLVREVELVPHREIRSHLIRGDMESSDFVTRIVFWVGISFEMPMVLALAARLGLVRARQLLKFWRYAVVIIFIVAAVITPTPDPFNQTLVGGPLLVLYFIGVFLAWIVQPKKKKLIQEPV